MGLRQQVDKAIQPSIKRRTFLQGLFALPPMVLFRPRAALWAERLGLSYSDSEGTSAASLNVLKDDDMITFGIEYLP